MIEVIKLVEYAELAGFSMWPSDDKLIVKNGKNLPPNLKEQITLYRDEILEYLNESVVKH